MARSPKIIDIAKDIGIGQHGYSTPMGKTMLGTLAAGFLLKKIVDSSEVDYNDEELTKLMDQLYYNR